MRERKRGSREEGTWEYYLKMRATKYRGWWAIRGTLKKVLSTFIELFSDVSFSHSSESRWSSSLSEWFSPLKASTLRCSSSHSACKNKKQKTTWQPENLKEILSTIWIPEIGASKQSNRPWTLLRTKISLFAILLEFWLLLWHEWKRVSCFCAGWVLDVHGKNFYTLSLVVTPF